MERPVIHKHKLDSTKEQGYQNAWEHLKDELAVLDLKIQLHVALKKSIDSNPSLEHLKGLVLFQEEIEQLFEEDDDQFEDTDVQNLQSRIVLAEQQIAQRLSSSQEAGTFLPFPYLSALYDLSDFEKTLIVTLLASDIHRKYEKLFAFLQDDVTCKRPTIDLVMKLCGYSEQERYLLRDRLVESTPLRKYILVSDSMPNDAASTPFLSQVYQIDGRVTRFLLGSQHIDYRLEPFSQLISTEKVLDPIVDPQGIQESLRQFFAESKVKQISLSKSSFIHIWGQAGSGKKLHVQHLSQYIRQHVLLVDVRQLVHESLPLERLLAIVQRECSLQQAILCLEHLECLYSTPSSEADEQEQKMTVFWNALKGMRGTVFLLSEKQLKPVDLIKTNTFIDLSIPTPTAQDRKRLWERALAGYTLDPGLDLGSVASKFRFTYGQIKNAIKIAQDIRSWHRPHDDRQTVQVTELHEACYRQIEHHLEKKATRIQPKYSWEDLILPGEQKTELRNACNQMKYRHIVYDQWGFEEKLAYGKGLSLLFTGPPGTGKTMSAQIIARELDLQIYKIDLSQVISKYIGETEKNLQEIFSEAQYSHAILFFDEADALFGKRSEVKDAHDKYANVETSYLLQKMEEYEGISILASNYLQNIDEAFMRRINFIVKYPFPDQVHRRQLWCSLFPKDAPVSKAVDQSFLAEKLELTGGQIKNIVVASAFLAAAQGEAIDMKHIWQAAKHEIQKSGKIFLKHELGVDDLD